MFDSTDFNQDISRWNVSSVRDMSRMFDQSALSAANYDAILIGWSSLMPPPMNLNFGAEAINYCSAAAAQARDTLINMFGWSIQDDGQDCN